MVLGAGGHCRHQVIYGTAYAVAPERGQAGGHESLLATGVGDRGQRLVGALGWRGVEPTVRLSMNAVQTPMACAAPAGRL